nr:immunoglobulin heavy chain junction region [Mus musculus]
CAQLGRYFDYW